MSNAEGPDLNLEDSGISEEDRREIAERIETISLESRIEVTAETFAFRGTRRSGVLPFLANVVALVLIAAGVLGAYLVFQQRQAEISTAEGTFTTAEGLLIAELRRQTAEELGAKDRAMGDVRRQLTEVQIERDEVLAEIDVRVREREEELRQELIAELEAERERLLDAGASESSIQARLAEIESNQDAEIEALLFSYRQQLQDEYATNLARLQTLQRQYEQELRALQQERLAISRDSEEREQELREQIVTEASTNEAAVTEAAAETEAARQAAQAAAAEAEEATEALAQARAELSSIAEQENQKALVDAQLNGLYRQIAERVLLDEYPPALARLASLRAVLADPQFADLPGIRERVEVDLAVASTLEALIRAQMAARPERTEAEDLLGRLRTAEQRARTLARQGDEEAAREAYLAALEVVPEVAASYDYLLARERAQATARELEFDGALAEAQTRAGELETARAQATARAEALARELADAEQVAGARVAELEQAVAASQARIGELDRVIAASQARVDELEAAEAESVGGSDALAALQTRLDEAETARDEALAELERVRAEAAAQVERARLQTAETAETVTDEELAAVREELERVISGLEQEVGLLSRELEDARERLAGETATVAALSAREEDLTARLVPLRELADRYEAMLSRYTEYTAREDDALAGSGAGSIAEAKLELDAFLTSPTVLEAFPELFDRFSRYQRAFESEGRETAILELIDVVYNLSAYDASDERVAFLEREIDNADEGSFMRDFLAELVYVVER